MTDKRNIAHDKKVQQEKKNHHEAISPNADETPQPGRKPHQHHDEPASDDGDGTDDAGPAAAKTP